MFETVLGFCRRALRAMGLKKEKEAEAPFWSEENQRWLAKGLEAYKAGEFVPHDLVEDK
jgi:hypothetical protein